MGGFVYRCDRPLDDARRVNHDLVRFRNLDRAVFGQNRLTGQNVGSLSCLRAPCLGAVIAKMAGNHTATASAAAARHAAIRNGDLVGPEHVKQGAAGLRVQMQIEGFYYQFHASSFFSCLRMAAILARRSV
ncbi:hypothetical protein SDC9_125590 [bioreactor metagenome]|uniref:Uncharacterized protein n=1 Tax=bioreactor metagenome TaxID=1076179 RepID=A0A645CNV2_9ZZZZ